MGGINKRKNQKKRKKDQKKKEKRVGRKFVRKVVLRDCGWFVTSDKTSLLRDVHGGLGVLLGSLRALRSGSD